MVLGFTFHWKVKGEGHLNDNFLKEKNQQKEHKELFEKMNHREKQKYDNIKTINNNKI